MSGWNTAEATEASARAARAEMLERFRTLVLDPEGEAEMSYSIEERRIGFRQAGWAIEYALEKTRPFVRVNRAHNYWRVEWVERSWGPQTARGTTRRVSTLEVYAVLSQWGCEEPVSGEEPVRELIEAAVTELRGGGRFRAQRHENARSLARSLREAEEGPLAGLAGVQKAVVEELEAGVHVSAMCRRGGFIGPRGSAETSGFLRRVGLEPMNGRGYRGKKVYRRALRVSRAPEMARMMADAVDREPYEVGL